MDTSLNTLTIKKTKKPIDLSIKPKKLESTPEIEAVREAYRALRKSLKEKSVDIAALRIMKRKGVYGIKIGITDEKSLKLVPSKQGDVPVYKVEIIKMPAILSNHAYNGKNFIIETVKWKWASKVQSKGVYRDDEFVRTKTKEEALEAIEFLMSKSRGLTYTITVFKNDEYFTYFRHSMPCLGGLVKYRDSHGEKHYMNPYFPRDIYVAFPEGEIIYIACHRSNLTKDLQTPFYEFAFSQESPWVSAFGTKETIIFKGNYFVLTNMNTDPTVFYSLMRLGGLAYHGSYGIYGATKNKTWPIKAEILFSKSAHADPRRLAGQKPIRISGGTWAEGFGYTRPYNESIFKTSLPHKLNQFGKLAGYPQAAYSNKYFLKEMKDKFGVAATAQTDKVRDALIEAWDYFKEESKKMGE